MGDENVKKFVVCLTAHMLRLHDLFMKSAQFGEPETLGHIIGSGVPFFASRCVLCCVLLCFLSLASSVEQAG